MFLKLQKSDGKTVWVNPESIAFIQEIEFRGGQTITSLTLTTLTSRQGPNGEPYSASTEIKVMESPQQIADRSGSKK